VYLGPLHQTHWLKPLDELSILMITNDELPGFCKALLGIHGYWRLGCLLESSLLRLYVHFDRVKASIERVPESPLSDLPSVKLLLEPFCRLHSVRSAEIFGFLSDQYRYDVERSVCKSPPETEAVVLKVSDLNDVGNEAYSNKDFALAISLCEEGMQYVETGFNLAGGHAAIKTGRFIGQNGIRAGCILESELRYGLARAHLALGQNRKAREWAEIAANRATENLHITRWPQQARFWFCRAMASKGLGEMERALGELDMVRPLLKAVLAYQDMSLGWNHGLLPKV